MLLGHAKSKEPRSPQVRVVLDWEGGLPIVSGSGWGETLNRKLVVAIYQFPLAGRWSQVHLSPPPGPVPMCPRSRRTEIRDMIKGYHDGPFGSPSWPSSTLEET